MPTISMDEVRANPIYYHQIADFCLPARVAQGCEIVVHFERGFLKHASQLKPAFVAEVIRLTEAHFNRGGNFGRVTLKQLKSILGEHGLSLYTTILNEPAPENLYAELESLWNQRELQLSKLEQISAADKKSSAKEWLTVAREMLSPTIIEQIKNDRERHLLVNLISPRPRLSFMDLAAIHKVSVSRIEQLQRGAIESAKKIIRLALVPAGPSVR